MDVYTVTVGGYVPEGGGIYIDCDREINLTYAGVDKYNVGDKVKFFIKGELYIGRITARGRDVELYADFPAGLRQIKSRVEP